MESEGDVRVLLVMDLVLSFVFSVFVVYALDLARIAEFSWSNVGVATVFLAAITYVVVLR